MASVAVSRQRCVVPVGVAGGAGDSDVRASERKRSVVVIERRWAPAGRGVAERAIGREPGRNVVWICRSAEIRLVA